MQSDAFRIAQPDLPRFSVTSSSVAAQRVGHMTKLCAGAVPVIGGNARSRLTGSGRRSRELIVIRRLLLEMRRQVHRGDLRRRCGDRQADNLIVGAMSAG